MIYLNHGATFILDDLVYDDGDAGPGDGDYPTQETLVFWKGLQSKI